jgi:AcrR family transcriptional regulator
MTDGRLTRATPPSAGARPWRGEPLPHGRHNLSAEEVRASQRERLVRAMLECVSERGFAETTVGDVVSAARASRNSFYQHFADKVDCFLAVCDWAAKDLLGEVQQFVTERDWLTALRRGLAAYLRFWAERPNFSVAYLVELATAGRLAVEQRERHYRSFEAMFGDLGARARGEQPELPPLSAVTCRLIVLGTTELVAGEVRGGRIDQLEELEEELFVFMVRLLADDATAQRGTGA